MTTWIEVADSALKMGLSGLIGGFFSWRVARVTLHAQETRDRRTKRATDFDRVIDAMTNARHSAHLFVDVLGDWIVNQGSDVDPDEVEVPLKDAKAALELAVTDLTNADTRLSVLGEADCASKLVEYRHALDAFYRDAWNRRDAITDGELGVLNDGLEEPKAKVLDALSKAYRAQVA